MTAGMSGRRLFNPFRVDAIDILIPGVRTPGWSVPPLRGGVSTVVAARWK